MMPKQIEAIRKRVEAATPGPWSYNSYSSVDSDALCAKYDDPGTPDYPDKPRPCTISGIAFDEADNTWLAQQHAAYEAEPTVAWVPAEYGDTATGRHAADAEFIAHARTDVPELLDELKRLRLYISILTPYAEQLHPLGVSQDDCNDECINAEAIKYGLALLKGEI